VNINYQVAAKKISEAFIVNGISSASKPLIGVYYLLSADDAQTSLADKELLTSQLVICLPKETNSLARGDLTEPGPCGSYLKCRSESRGRDKSIPHHQQRNLLALVMERNRSVCIPP